MWFSAANPVECNVSALVGKALWATVPFANISAVLASLAQAWAVDPVNTVATCVVPEWTTTSWYRKFLRRCKPLFRVLHRYPLGEWVFRFKHTLAMAPPCPFPILVIRLGVGKGHGGN